MKFQFFFILFLIPFFIDAQTNTKDEKPYIEVVGTADMEIIPDEIYIEIILKEKYVNREKITIEAQEEKLKTALTSINIDLTNLYLSDANAGFVRIPWRKKDVIARKDYTLKVADAETVGKVFQELDKLEIIDASIKKVNHSKIDSLRKEVEIMAVKNGKEKANYLLKAIGEEIDKTLIVTENTQVVYKQSDYKDKTYQREFEERLRREFNSHLSESEMLQMVYETYGEGIQFKKVLLVSSIYLKFSIK